MKKITIILAPHRALEMEAARLMELGQNEWVSGTNIERWLGRRCDNVVEVVSPRPFIALENRDANRAYYEIRGRLRAENTKWQYARWTEIIFL